MMASDSERREVAENLRYLADYPGAPVRYAEQFRDELSAVVLPDGFTHDYSELIQRLADLIEPPARCPHYHSDRHYCSVHEDMALIDRDALLALADELDRSLGWCEPDANSCVKVKVSRLLDVSRRVREACGEEVA